MSKAQKELLMLVSFITLMIFLTANNDSTQRDLLDSLIEKVVPTTCKTQQEEIKIEQ